MKQFIFLLRPNVRPLTTEQVEERTKRWRLLINELNHQKKLVAWQVFEDEGVKISGTAERTEEDLQLIKNSETLGGAITISAKSFEEAAELSKLCPVLDYGGSVEVRPLQPQHNHLNINLQNK